MKILIITASAGMGHNRAADALTEYFKTNHPEIQTKQIDLVNYLGFGSRWFYFKSYEIIIKYWPKFWGFWDWLTENKITGQVFDFLTAINKKLNCQKLFNEIKKYQPDYILCTHFTPADLILNFSNINIPIATVITDYAPCRMWACSKNQKCFVAHEFTKKQLEKYGILPENIIVSGIPIGINFIKKIQEIKKNIKKNILIMPTPKGKIKIKKLVDDITKNFPEIDITIIYGKNPNYKQVPNVKILEFVNNPEDYMSMADLIISKAGGITITEILTLNKPLIIINPIPGQETRNTKFLIDNNLAAEAKNNSEAIDLIQKILNKNLEFKKPDFITNPAEEIAKNILN